MSLLGSSAATLVRRIMEDIVFVDTTSEMPASSLGSKDATTGKPPDRVRRRSPRRAPAGLAGPDPRALPGEGAPDQRRQRQAPVALRRECLPDHRPERGR